MERSRATTGSSWPFSAEQRFFRPTRVRFPGWSTWRKASDGTRDRSLWCAMIAARAAAAFGPAVIDGYGKMLANAQHPVGGLDAILGLASIGVCHEAARRATIDVIQNERERLNRRPVIAPEFFALGFAPGAAPPRERGKRRATRRAQRPLLSGGPFPGGRRGVLSGPRDAPRRAGPARLEVNTRALRGPRRDHAIAGGGLRHVCEGVDRWQRADAYARSRSVISSSNLSFQTFGFDVRRDEFRGLAIVRPAPSPA